MTDLHIQNLQTAHGTRGFHLGPIDAKFTRGKISALIGRNGAGKTTLLRAIAGLTGSTSDAITLSGRALDRKNTAWIPHGAATPSPFTVNDILIFGRYPIHHGYPSKADQQAVALALQSMNLTALRDRRLSTLSSGELQKAHIARALALTTDVLLFDEPTANLDVAAAREVMQLLQDLARKTSCVIIFSSHDLSLIEDFADDVVGIQNGKVAATWNKDQINHRDLVSFFA